MSKEPIVESRVRISPSLRKAVGIAAVAPEVPPGPLRGALIETRKEEVIEGLPVELAPDSKIICLESGGVGVTNAVLPGFWHLSIKEIKNFTHDKTTDAASNLGPGTYVGHGILTGTRVEHLQRERHVKHDLRLRGNLLLVPIEDQADVSWEVAEDVFGEDGVDSVAHMAASKRLNKALRAGNLNGEQFDGFVFIHPAHPDDPTGERTAEGILFNPEQTIQIVGRTVVEPAVVPGE